MKNWLDKYNDEIPSAQKGKTITVDSKNDPRYKAYRDSLALYKTSLKNLNAEKTKSKATSKKLGFIPFDEFKTFLPNSNLEYNDINMYPGPADDYKNNTIGKSNKVDKNKLNKLIKNNIKPVGFDVNEWKGQHSLEPTINYSTVYKKPQQPVIVKEQERPNTYQDSLIAYNRDNNFDREFKELVKKAKTQEEINIGKSKLEKKYPRNNVKPIIDRTLKESPTIAVNPYTGYKAKDTEVYKKPIGNNKPAIKPSAINLGKLTPIGLQNTNQEIQADIPEMHQQARIPKYYNVTDNNNQKFGGSDSTYKVENLDELRELPTELWDRKITPQFQNGGIIKDNNGYWNPDNWGKQVEIGSPNITMMGVNQTLIGESKETGEKKLMVPGKNYKFAHTKNVIETPVSKNWLNKYQ
jgi:hypothetical protein